MGPISVGALARTELVNLTNLFRLHAILAGVYAVGLIVVPERLIGLLTALPLNAVAVDVARLFGGVNVRSLRHLLLHGG